MTHSIQYMNMWGWQAEQSNLLNSMDFEEIYRLITIYKEMKIKRYDSILIEGSRDGFEIMLISIPDMTLLIEELQYLEILDDETLNKLEEDVSNAVSNNFVRMIYIGSNELEEDYEDENDEPNYDPPFTKEAYEKFYDVKAYEKGRRSSNDDKMFR